MREVLFTNCTQLENCPEVEEYLKKTLEKMGVVILNNYNFEGVNLNETNDAIISYRFKEEGSDKVEGITGNLIVTGGLIDVDQTVFKFIHENKLVYNGRAIIDRNFLTSDNSIFAAGRLCEFSQRYKYIEKGKPLRLEW
jgi:thioredoxin reductase